MSQERRSIPFPQIPHDYDYEGKVNPALPKADDSVFFNFIEKAVMRDPQFLAIVEKGQFVIPFDTTDVTPLVEKGFDLIGNWLTAPNSDGRRKALEALKAFCSAGSIENYRAIGHILFMQNASSQAKDKVQTLMDEFKPPTNVKIMIQLQEHTVSDSTHRAVVKDELLKDLREAFVKGEQNFLLLEDANGELFRDKKLFQEGFSKYRSYRKASIFREFVRVVKRAPTDSELDELVNIYHQDMLTYQNPDAKYGWLEKEVIDELLDEGFDISIIHENGSPNYVPDNAYATDLTLDEFKEQLIKVNADSHKRNATIASQIEHLAAIASKGDKKTNICARFGTYHYPIIDSLPAKLRMVTQVTVTPHPKSSPVTEQLNTFLYSGEEVSEELWKAAYKHFFE